MAFNYYHGTADKDALVTGRGLVMGIVLYAAAADSYVELKDAVTAAAGSEIGKVSIDVSLEGDTSTKTLMFPEPVKFHTGLSVDVNGAGAEYWVYYKKRY